MMGIIRRFFNKGREENPRAVPLHALMKGTAIIVIGPFMLLSLYVLYRRLDLHEALLGLAFIFVISIIFIRPYIANLSALTNYVNQLAQDKKAEEPDLTFLNNVQELSKSVDKLHRKWEQRRNQLEAMVAESKILIDSLPDILIMLDEHFNIVRTNSTAQMRFGGKYFREYLENIIQDPSLNALAKDVLTDREGRNMEFHMDEPSSRDFFVRIERFPLYSPSGIAFIIVMHDITEQKRTERMLSDFVANASHEIRTPLTSIIGFIETLQTSAKDDPAAREKFLKIMADQAERMAKLVKDLLSLSHIEMNVNTRPSEKMAISDVLSEVALHVEWGLRENNMTLNMELDDDIPRITGDIDELIQVFNNLVGNSVKYAGENSTVTIRVHNTQNTFTDEPRLREFDRLLAISVSDEGEGIPPEHLPRLTERFYRVNTPVSRKVSGTGLGLSIVKHIVERHRGLLTIESEVGKGSIFTVYLPAA